MKIAPFTRLTVPTKQRLLIVMLGLTVVVMAALGALDRPLQTAAAPFGIVSFEFAGNLPASTRMIEQWGPEGKVYAGLSLGVDYLFMPAYSCTLALACALIAGRLATGLPYNLGIGVAWLQFVAAGLDTIENFALIQLLLGSLNSLWPPLALWCAGTKFVLILAGLLYILAGGLGIIVQCKIRYT